MRYAKIQRRIHQARVHERPEDAKLVARSDRAAQVLAGGEPLLGTGSAYGPAAPGDAMAVPAPPGGGKGVRGAERGEVTEPVSPSRRRGTAQRPTACNTGVTPSRTLLDPGLKHNGARPSSVGGHQSVLRGPRGMERRGLLVLRAAPTYTPQSAARPAHSPLPLLCSSRATFPVPSTPPAQ